MASITEQIVLELNVKGNKKLERALRGYVKLLQETIEKTREKNTTDKTATRQLNKLQMQLKDFGITRKDANIKEREWRQALEGNVIMLDKVVHSINKRIGEEKRWQANFEKGIKAEEAARKKIDELKFQLRHYGKTVKDVTAWEKLRKAAINGNKKAMQMLNKEVNKAVTSTTKHTKSIIEQIFGVRNLRNEAEGVSISFSVLRSKLLLLSFGFGMVSKTIGVFVKAAGDAEEITNKFNVVFGESAEEAERFAESIGQRATSEVQNFLAVIQDTLVPLGFMRDFASDLSQVTVQLALDVASFNNKMDADVLRDFQSAMVGNHETVKKYGIILNQARVEMEAHRLGLVQADGTISEMGKTYGRLSLMVKGSTDAHGDLLKTQDEFNNQLKAFQATTKRTMEDIGNVLKPLVTLLLRFANVALSPSAVFGYTTALAALGARFLYTAGVVAKLRKAFISLNLVMLLNPTTALVAGVGLLAAGLHALFTRSKEAKDGIKDISEEFGKLTLEIAKYEAMTLEGKIVVQKQKLAELNKELDKHNEKLEEQIVVIRERGNLLRKSSATPLIKEEREALEKRKKAVEAEIETLKELIKVRNWEKSQKFQEEIDKIAASYENEMFMAKQLTEEQKELAKISIKLGIDMQELTDKPLTEQAVKLQELIFEGDRFRTVQIMAREEQERMKEAMDEMSSAVEADQKRIQKLLENTLTGQKKKIENDIALLEGQVGLNKGSQDYVEALDKLKAQLDEVNFSLENYGTTMGEGIKIDDEDEKKKKKKIDQLKELIKSYEDEIFMMGNAVEGGKAFKLETEAMAKAAIALGLDIDKLPESLLKVIGSWSKMVEEQEKENEAIEKHIKFLNDLEKAQDAAARKFDEWILKKFKEIDFTNFLRGAEEVQKAYEKLEPPKKEDLLGESFEVNIGFFQSLAMAIKATGKETEEFREALSKAMDDGVDFWGQWNSQIDTTIGAFDKLGQAEIEDARNRELRNAEGIRNENRRRAKIEEINKRYDAKESDRRKRMKMWKVSSAISNVALGITQTWRDPKLDPFSKWAFTALQAAAGYAQIKTIQAQQFAKGGDFIADKPEVIQVGEAGRERVTITPIDRPESRALGSMGGVTVNFSGNVLSQDFIEDEAIPMIKEAVRRGADIGVA